MNQSNHQSGQVNRCPEVIRSESSSPAISGAQGCVCTGVRVAGRALAPGTSIRWRCSVWSELDSNRTNPATSEPPRSELLPSSAGVRLTVDRAETFDTDMCVELSGRERCVAQQFLDDAQVRTTLEEMRRCRVSETVRT